MDFAGKNIRPGKNDSVGIVPAIEVIDRNCGLERMKNLIQIANLLAVELTFLSLCFAQTVIDLRTQSKSADFSSAITTRPFKTGAALPAACQVGESFFKTDATAGENLYGCTAPDVWTKLNMVELPSSSGQSGKLLSTDGAAARWTAIGGDVDGSPGANVVRKVQGRRVSSAAPADADVLQWNSAASQWEPLPNNPVLSTGDGIIAIGPTVSVDEATVPQYLVGAVAPAMTCQAGRSFYTNLSNQTLYYCGSTNTWVPLSRFGHTHSAAEITSGTLATNKIAAGTDGQCLITSGGTTSWGPCPGGSGDVTGPAAAEDYGFTLYEGVTGARLRALNGLKADGQGNVSVPGWVTTGDGTAAGELQLCPPNSTNCVSWMSPAARTTETKLTLPAGDPGAARQALVFGIPAGGVSSGAWQNVYAPGDTIASADLPTPTTAAGGKVRAITCAGGQFVNAINLDSTVTCGAAPAGSKYAGLFDSQLNITVSGSSHNLGTCDVRVEVFDTSTPSRRVEPDRVTCDAATNDVVIAFAVSQSGRYVIQ